MSQKARKVNPDWEAFVRQRLNELHTIVFGDHGGRVLPQTLLVNRLAYFAYHKLVNDYGYGTDLTQHPNNPFYHP